MVGAMSGSASECIEATVAVLGFLQLDTVPVAWLDQVRETGLISSLNQTFLVTPTLLIYRNDER